MGKYNFFFKLAFSCAAWHECVDAVVLRILKKKSWVWKYIIDSCLFLGSCPTDSSPAQPNRCSLTPGGQICGAAEYRNSGMGIWILEEPARWRSSESSYHWYERSQWGHVRRQLKQIGKFGKLTKDIAVQGLCRHFRCVCFCTHVRGGMYAHVPLLLQVTETPLQLVEATSLGAFLAHETGNGGDGSLPWGHLDPGVWRGSAIFMVPFSLLLDFVFFFSHCRQCWFFWIQSVPLLSGPPTSYSNFLDPTAL